MTFDPGRVNSREIAAAIDRIGLTAHVERSVRNGDGCED